MTQVRRRCVECGRVWHPSVNLYSPTCRDCRVAAAAPKIAKLRAMSPCCRAAYAEGRLAAGVDANRPDALAKLGRILTKLRKDQS